MSHEFESGVFYGEAAWHGLGTTLDVADPRRRSVTGTMQAAGLDWEVCKLPLMVANSVDVPAEIRGGGILGAHGIFRQSDWAHLGTVGDKYEPLQNSQIFQWFQPFLDSGEVQFETAGSLKEGRIIWVLARLNRDDIDVGGGDTVRKYLQLSSSHDGSMATRVGFCPIRTVCWNTLSANFANKQSAFLNVRHTIAQTQTLAAIQDVVNTVDAAFEATAAQYRRLATCGISNSDLRRYVKLVLELPEEQAAISSRAQNQLDRIVALALRGVGQDGKPTAWGAYNGITQWLTHERQKDQSTRLESAWFGSSAALNTRAFDLALQLAS